MQLDVVQVDMLKLFFFCCDELEIKINYLLGEDMLVCRVASFIYWDKGSELVKSCFKERLLPRSVLSPR